MAVSLHQDTKPLHKHVSDTGPEFRCQKSGLTIKKLYVPKAAIADKDLEKTMYNYTAELLHPEFIEK